MQVITIHNEKGGVGKTTLSSFIGAGLSMKGYRVVLIDADGQGNLTTNMGIVEHGGFYNFVMRNNRNSPDYIPTRKLLLKPDPAKHPDNLYVVAGNSETAGITSKQRIPELAKSIASRLKELEGKVDYVIIDTQPSGTTLHDVVALITDWYICPTDCEPLSAYNGLASAIEHINFAREYSLRNGRNKAKLLGIIPNKYRATTSLHQQVYATLINGFRDEDGELSLDDEGNIIFAGYDDAVWQPIPLRINMSEGQLLQASIIYTAPHLQTSQLLQTVIDRVEFMTQESEGIHG